MPHDRSLHALAGRLGILPSYVSQSGAEIRSTSDETRVAILAAMGFDASTEARARQALAGLVERERERIAAPVRVVREREVARDALRVRVPRSWGARAGERVEYELELRGDAGGPGSGHAHVLLRRDGEAEAGAGGALALALGRPVAPGYHELRIALAARGRSGEARQRLIVVPDRCVTPERRGFGIVANLYSVRGERSWGVGSLADLAGLARWSGELGAAFVGVNPLHALRNHGGDISPYSPVSRLYRNPAYLDVESVPELAECDEARALLASGPVRAEIARLRRSDLVEYERKARLARPVLTALHRYFVRRNGCPHATLAGAGELAGATSPATPATPAAPATPADPPRTASSDRAIAYTAYLQREGQALETFAIFSALEEHFTGDSDAPLQWQLWPTAYQDPASPEVLAFARSHELEVDFHRWVQFELDRQLGAAADAGARSGLTIGLYQDLAVASSPSGSDVWASRAMHADGVSIGAPPDNYSATGQNWGLSPLDPHRLFEDGYRFWTALIRSALRHAGALRIDHVLGLFRQFWIPAGMSGTEGAYVRFPTNDLLGILALESMRHQAVIVGEDLGTVPPEVPGTLREWGILGTRVMLFEREPDGEFRPAGSYEPLALATADTHDMAPLAGFWTGRDIDLAGELGLLPTSEAVSAARALRVRDRRQLVERLAADGALPASREAASLPGAAELRDAVHRFLCSTPAALVGISLDDLAGETEPVNIPGVGADSFPSWTRRMRAPFDSLEKSDIAHTLGPCARRGDEVAASGRAQPA